MTPAALFTAGLLLHVATVSLQGLTAGALTSTTKRFRVVPRREPIAFECLYGENESGPIDWCLRDSSNTTLTNGTDPAMQDSQKSVLELDTTPLQEGNYSVVCFLGSVNNKGASNVTFLITVLPPLPTIPPTTSVVSSLSSSSSLPSLSVLLPSTSKPSATTCSTGTTTCSIPMTATIAVASTTSDAGTEMPPITDQYMDVIVLGTSLLCVILFLLIVFVSSLICLWFVRQSNSSSSDEDLSNKEEVKVSPAEESPELYSTSLVEQKVPEWNGSKC